MEEAIKGEPVEIEVTPDSMIFEDDKMDTNQSEVVGDNIKQEDRVGIIDETSETGNAFNYSYIKIDLKFDLRYFTLY